MSLPLNRAQTHFALHSDIKKDVAEKWEQLSDERKAFWERIATAEYDTDPDILKEYIRRYNEVWESAPGITAHNVEAIRKIAILNILCTSV